MPGPLQCTAERSGCHVWRVLAAAFLGEELEVRHTVVSPSEVLRHVEVLLELTDLPPGDGHHLQLGLSLMQATKLRKRLGCIQMLHLLLLGMAAIFVLVLLASGPSRTGTSPALLPLAG